MALNKQMEMFEDGGLKDEGGMIDEVSGNDVPSGSTREEVRDDIPAQLSEGEFVFPADVVRFIGLEKLMQLRQEAKQGLKQMEAMGQMGNSDEATMRDDMPFDINDLDMEDEVEYNRGGVIEAANGTFVQNTMPITYNPLNTTQTSTATGNPTQMQPTAVTSNPYTGNPQTAYKTGIQPYAPVDYTTALGTSAVGAPQTESVRYFNAATGQSRTIPHIINADGSRGATLFPVPKGFVIQEEAPKEEAKKTTKVQSAKVAPVESGDGGDGGGGGGGAVDLAGDPLSYRSIFNMDKLDKAMSRVGLMQFGSLGKSGISQGVYSSVKGTAERNQVKLGAITGTFRSLKTKLGLDGRNLGDKDITQKDRDAIAAEINRVSAAVERFTTKTTFTGKRDANGNAIVEETGKSLEDTTKEVNELADKYGVDGINTKKGNLSVQIGAAIARVNAAIKDQPTYSEDPSDTIESKDPTAGDVYSEGTFGKDTQTVTAAEQAANQAAAQSFIDSGNDSDNNQSSSTSGGGYSGSDDLGGEDVAKGSLITKRKASGKIKKKYMKRGGLASR